MALGLGLGLPYVLSPVGWSPASLGASLLGWWDAERVDLITESGGSVSSWRDAVAGYDAAQAIGSARPIYSASSFNGRPGVSFDGADDELTLGSVPFPTGANPAEIWALGDQQALAADTLDRIAFVYGGAGATTRVANYRRSITGVNRAAGGVGNGVAGVFPSNASVDDSGRHLVRLVFDGTNTRVDADGIAGANVAVIPATGTTRTRIGALNGTTASGFWQGGVNAILVTALLSDADAALLTTYLKSRGGIP